MPCRLVVVVALAVSGAIGCAAGRTPSDSDPVAAPGPDVELPAWALSVDIVALELDVAEAAMREIMRDNASAIGADASRYCLRLFGEDPDVSFFTRFGDLPQTIVGASAFSGRRRSRDLIIRVSAIEFIDPKHVVVSAGYHRGKLSASSNSLWMERKDGVWIVTERVLDFIS